MSVLVVVAVVFVDGSQTASAASNDTRVRSFEEVRASELVFERDPTNPGRGIFRVTTTEPMICAIVWGPDKRLGRFNNSLSMNGTGIVDHDVFLPDAQGGVKYHYIVQGTTADGTLYRSKRSSFVLPEARSVRSAREVDESPNLALGATVAEVSSEFSASFAASNAFDGDTSTEWSTRGDGNDGSIAVDLGVISEISGVEFVTRSMPDGSAITKTFTVSVDDGAPLERFRAGTLARPRRADIQATGRVIRFDVESSTGGNVGAIEIRVFAAS